MKKKKILEKVKLGMTREEVVAILGEPDGKGGATRKYPTPSIYLYGKIELWFHSWKSGTLHTAYTEDKNGNGIILLREDNDTQANIKD